MTRHGFPTYRSGAGIVLGLGLFALLGAPGVAADAPRIHWREDLGAARLEAQAKGRPVWIQFTGPWCHYCHLMERESFTHAAVVGHSRESFVPVKLQSDAHEELALRLGIEGLPASVIVAPSGQVLAKHEGYVDGDTFRAFLEAALARSGVRPEPVRDDPPAGAKEVALAGYCPVSLVRSQRLVPGRDALAVEHAGQVFRLADARVLREFRKQPERFAPVNRGRCPVSEVDRGESRPGHPRFGVLYGGHLFLCADEAERTRFLRNPLRYRRVDAEDRELCPHCWASDPVVARGLLAPAPAVAWRRDPASEVSPREAVRGKVETARR